MTQTVLTRNIQTTDKEKAFEKIADVINMYREKEGSLIQVLHHSQSIYGCLPLEVQEFIAEKMNISLAKVSGVVTFYSFFSTVPKGEHTIRICMGTACYVRGGKKIEEYLKKHLNIEAGGTTADGKFTFEIARCFGACGLAPAMMIDDTVYKQIKINKLNKILAKY
jgi:NADH:ubiquinone oxidoreductase subunit E